MAEDFDVSVDVNTGSDLPVCESTDIAGIEPLDDIPVDESVSMDSANELESPISEQELTELQNEAAALEIQPLDEGVDLGFNIDEVMAEPETTEQPYEPSTLENIAAAAVSNADSPGTGARIIGGLAGDPASNGYAAQLAQMGIDAALPAAEGFMEAAHSQHALDYQRPSFPREGVDFIRNENGETEPIHPMVHTTDENGESIWVRPENDTKEGQNDG
jgi:hypothetical protein